MLSSLPKTFLMLINTIGRKSDRKTTMDTLMERTDGNGKMSAHEAYSPYRRSLY